MTYIEKKLHLTLLTPTNMQILWLTPTKMQILCLTPKTSNIVKVNLNISLIKYLIITKKKIYIVIIDIVIIFKKHL